MASAIGVALGAAGNIGQLYEIGQAQKYQTEQVRWTRRGYVQDTQSLRFDLLGACTEEIRAHYQTYIGRMHTLMLANTILWIFGLASLQFSGEFLPSTEGDCPDCIEADNEWLVYVWVWLVAIILVLPFWGILSLLRCKQKLDNWLEFSLGSLNRERRSTLCAVSGHFSARRAAGPVGPVGSTPDDKIHEEMEQVVARLGGFIVEYQEYFMRVWNVECRWLIRLAVMLLWLAASMAVTITGLMFWIFLRNRWKTDTIASTHFAVLMIAGFVVPIALVMYQSVTREEDNWWEEANPFVGNPEQDLSPFLEPGQYARAVTDFGGVSPTKTTSESSKQSGAGPARDHYASRDSAFDSRFSSVT